MKQRLQLCFDTKASFKAQAAFTLVELVTVVTIVGVIAAIAVPSFSSLMVGQRAGSAATDIYIALATARSEATKRNASVTLQPTAHSPCSSAIWKCGWTIADPDPTLTTPRNLLDHDSLSNASVTTTPTSLASVVYQSSGRIAGTTKPSFSITMTSGSASASKYVCLDLSGRPFIQNTACP
jgi:type IV fimbrial biogenesis protein FimT